MGDDLKQSPVPHQVGGQAEGDLPQGEGDHDGHPQDHREPRPGVLHRQDEGCHEGPDASHSRQESQHGEAIQSKTAPTEGPEEMF